MTNGREVRRISRDAELDAVNEELGDTPGPLDHEAEMQNILAEFDRTSEDDKWEIKVYRVLGSAKLGNREPFLFYASPTDFPILEKLRDEWANEQFGRVNTFRIRVYKNRMLVKNFTFDVEVQNKPPAPPITHEIKSEMAVFASALERIQAQNNAMFERLLQRLEHAPQHTQPPAADPIALFEKFSTIFANMGGNREQGFSALDVFDKALTLAEKIGGSDRETNLFDIVKEALAQLPALAALSNQPGASQPQQRPRIVPPGAPAAPAPQRHTAQPPAPPPQQPIAVGLNDQQLALARNLLLQLNEAAKGNAPVEQYAEWLDSNIPPVFLDQMLAIEDLRSWCVGIAPDVAPQWEWFAALFDALTEVDDDIQDNDDADLPLSDATGPSTPPASFNGNSGGTGGRKDDARHNVETGTSGKEKRSRKNKGG